MPETYTHTVCPSCAEPATGDPYDIGDGPEFCCRACDWCWGANGQPLSMDPVLRLHAIAREALGWDAPEPMIMDKAKDDT